MPHIRDLLGREGRGKGRVFLVPRLGAEQSVEIALPGGFNVSPKLAQAMKILPGVERVEELYRYHTSPALRGSGRGAKRRG